MSSLTDQLGFNFRPPQHRVWTVRDLVAAVRSHIEREYSDAWVEGEISNFRAPESGHLYFTLKDGDSQIRVVMFRSSARLLRFRPADGLQVVVRGRVTIYEDRGELQISAEHIEPKGAGSLQLAFEQLKAKLEAEGLFAAELRAPTPSAAAELVIRSRQDIEDQAAALHDRLTRAMRYRLLMGRQALTELSQHGAFARMMEVIRQRQQKLDDLTHRVELAQRNLLEKSRRRWEIVSAAVRHYDVRLVLTGMRKELESRTTALGSVMRNVLLQYRVRSERLETALRSLSPLAILDRGYALVFDANGKLLKDADAVKTGDEISARLAHGQIDAAVTKKQT